MAAINPVLAEDAVTKEVCPLPKAGEVFLLRRSDMWFQSGSSRAVCKGTGSLSLSSDRMVFIAETDKNNQEFGSYEVPLSSIRTQIFQQPIFGCNYLELRVDTSDASVTGDGNFPVYLYFYKGGAGTFLRVFYRLFAEIERQRAQRDGRAGGAKGNLGNLASVMLANSTGYADSDDPTTFYLQQPHVVGGGTTSEVGMQQGGPPAGTQQGPPPSGGPTAET